MILILAAERKQINQSSESFCHSFSGKSWERLKFSFGPTHLATVYLMRGSHWPFFEAWILVIVSFSV
jgi:hypothetical protein